MSGLPDPLQLWRNAINSLEGGGNALANKAMNTGDFTAALHQMANLSLGMQQTFEKVLGVYLRKLNLPSRKEVAELAAALQRIESRLDQLVPAPATTQAPRPPRTRRASTAAAPSPPPQPAAKAKTPTGRRTGTQRAAPKRGTSKSR